MSPPLRISTPLALWISRRPTLIECLRVRVYVCTCVRVYVCACVDREIAKRNRRRRADKIHHRDIDSFINETD